MENATKALIIAAAVLIAIILVALGIRLLNTTGDTSQEVEKTANAISDTMQGITGSLINDLLDVSSMDEKQFNDYIKENYSGEQTGRQVLELCSLLTTKYGSVHKSHSVTHITCGGSGIKSSNIYTKIEKNKKYKVTFSGANNIYSITVVEA